MLSTLQKQAFSQLISLKINSKPIQVQQGTLLIDAILSAGFKLPYICYHPDLPTSGGICRICVVKDTKKDQVLVSCRTEVQDGMEISTMDEAANNISRTNTALMFSYHPSTCISCPSSGNCRGQNICNQSSLNHSSALNEIVYNLPLKKAPQNIGTGAMMTNDNSSNIVKTKELCINCDRCIRTCEYLEGIGVYGWIKSDQGHSVGAYGPSKSNECIQCGQCINRCPVGALSEKSMIEEVRKALKDESNLVVFQTAPAVRVSIGEEFGLKAGEKILKKELVEGLKMLSQNVIVVDTNFGADLTIVEEASELLKRIGQVYRDGKSFSSLMPMITSCSPGWVHYIEKHYPQYLNKLSSCKSPQGMLGASIKAYYTMKGKWNPKKIINVGIMPCTAKKFEISRKEMEVDGIRDMDYVLTTRECAKLLKIANIDITKLKGMDYDHPMGQSSGAGMIFGVTGGVMEAALRTGYESMTGQEVPFKHLDITPVRGMDGIREATIPITTTKEQYKFMEGKQLKVAVAHGLANAKKLMEKIKEIEDEGKECPWQFIEIMACPGGCLGGGGQPKPTDKDVRQKRAKLVYEEDFSLPIRKSHENPEIIQLYKELYGEPCSEVAHKYLHTHYDDKSVKHQQFVDMSENQKFKQFFEKRFKKGDRQYLVEMFISIVDEFGYISDCALVEAAKYAGVNPVEALSTATAYNYFPLEKVGDNVVYVCQCENCILKGAKKVEKKLEEIMKIKMGETTPDGKFTLKKTNWLGWCVNNAPAVMLKQKGSDKVIPILNAEKKINSLSDITDTSSLIPENKIQVVASKNYPCSFFSEINIDTTIKKFLQHSKEDIIKMLEDTRLLGRGGAGFPAFIKWRSVLNEPDKEKYVVINADEGLPSTFKDWFLMTDPQNLEKMLLGALFCAQTVNAGKIFLYLRYEYRNLKENINIVISDLKAKMKLNTEFEIRLGGGPYIAGEETALFQSIEGKGARPRADRRKFPTQAGLFQKPTVINNVETFAAIPIIIAQGVESWNKAQLKDFPQKGMKLFNITGDVETPILCEFPLGTNLETILSVVKPGGEIIAAEVGGSTEKIIYRKDFNTPLAFMKGSLNAVGSIVLFNSTRNILDIYHQKLEFMQDESCKQCVPCRDGSVILAKILEEHIHKKKNYKQSKEMAKMIAESAEITSICGHGKALGSLFQAIDEFLEKSK